MNANPRLYNWLQTFHLRPYPLNQWPEEIRAFFTVVAIIGAIIFFSCILVILFLIVRLATDALIADGPNSQEAIKNFLLAFVSAFGAAFLVWRTWVAHQQSVAASEQARIALENHFTGVFVKAVELLGQVRDLKEQVNEKVETKSSPNTEARLGALYSLERMLNESEKDRRAILETLCAYVRENAPLILPVNDADKKRMFDQPQGPPTRTRVDVQAAIAIVGRINLTVRNKAKEWKLDFSGTNLSGYSFEDFNFDGVIFKNVVMNYLTISETNFLKLLVLQYFI